MLFLALTIYLAYQLRPIARHSDHSIPVKQEGRAWIGIGLFLIYLQIVLGALMRHSGAGLACLDIPFCRDSLWPSGSILLHMHMAHRWFAVLVSVILIGLGVVALRRGGFFRLLGIFLILGVLSQVTLGFLSVHSLLALTPVTIHLAVAALLWASLWLFFFSTEKPQK
jgi:heme A synthase